MTNKELRRFSRQELLELLVQQKQENEALQARVTELEELIKNRSIRLETAGSLARATLELNEVFARADKAAEEYLENIKRCSDQQDKIYEQIVAEAEQRAAEITGEAERKVKEYLEIAEAEKLQKKKDIDEYWNGLKERLEAFYQEHVGLKEALEKPSEK